MSSRMRAAACIRRRCVSRPASSPGCGSSWSSSRVAWRRKSSSARTKASAASASASALRACPSAAQAARTPAPSTPAKRSSSRRWPRGFSRPPSSCWPCSSTSVSASARSTSTDTLRSLTQAVLRPSRSVMRRTITSSSPPIPASARTSRAAWPSGRSNTAVTSPCCAPTRSRSLRPRQPSTNPSASSRIDLPAPVSPVSTLRPGCNARVSRSMISRSLISRPRSTAPPPDQSHSPLITCR